MPTFDEAAANCYRMLLNWVVTIPRDNHGAPQAKASEPHQHDGAELIYVIKGRLMVNVDGDDIALDAGDAMYFDSSAPHSYRREGRPSCSAIVVVAPK